MPNQPIMHFVYWTSYVPPGRRRYYCRPEEGLAYLTSQPHEVTCENCLREMVAQHGDDFSAIMPKKPKEE
jgi:hypothetical protein